MLFGGLGGLVCLGGSVDLGKYFVMMGGLVGCCISPPLP